ncbi:MAG TPA: DNA polymerase III subunit delta [Candidatus Binatia bacterium]|nr:DNA polymerase III subunit delta [Candidatus Binatia bacterium]
MRSFAASDRFVADVQARKLKAGYVFVGDEAFFRKRCRDAVLQYLIPAEVRDLSIYEMDLAETDLQQILDRARTPSLMAPFQVFFIRGIKNLYTRGKHDEEFAAIAEYFENPNPDALIILVADHISIPADVRRMELQDRDRYERIRQTLGKYCSILEFARVDEGDAVKWAMETAAAEQVKLDTDAARELVDSLGGDMMMIANELEKLTVYVGQRQRITLGDIETMVLAAKQRSFYELTDAISARDRTRALTVLDAILSSGDGEEAAIGHLYMLARTFRQMLVISERNVRDSRALWQALWQGFRVPPFAAEDVIRQARRYKSRRELTAAIRRIARADFALRSNPVSKRLVLENLVLDLTAEPKPQEIAWLQEQLPV